jgi:hypothetical protein
VGRVSGRNRADLALASAVLMLLAGLMAAATALIDPTWIRAVIAAMFLVSSAMWFQVTRRRRDEAI